VDSERAQLISKRISRTVQRKERERTQTVKASRVEEGKVRRKDLEVELLVRVPRALLCQLLKRTQMTSVELLLLVELLEDGSIGILENYILSQVNWQLKL